MDVTVHYYCGVCEGYMGDNVEQNSCASCNITESSKKSLSAGRYFLVKTIESQLQNMFEKTNLWSLLKENNPYKDRNSVSEVYTGSIYQFECMKKFLQDPQNFTMFFSSDGINPTSKSLLDIWPLFVGFNELSTCHKSEFLFMEALWVGKKKPRMDTFLRPFVAETEKLYKEGFIWRDSLGNEHRSRVKFSLFIADAVARAALCNLTQFNGECGCMHCEHPGKQVAKRKGGAQMQCESLGEPPHKKQRVKEIRVYPFMLSQKERTQEEILSYAEQAVECGNPCKGVKGFSQLLFIPGFDMPKMTVPESLHCFWEGIGKQFLKLWSSDTGSPYYVVHLFKRLDESILNIKPPDDIRRVPRPFDKNFSLLKASELRTFCLFYSPIVLQGILPPKFYNHWLLVVNLFRILYQKHISKGDMTTAKLLADKFIIEISSLYGEDKVSYNVHLLTHVVDATERLGAPWSNSSFIIESACGVLARFFKGPTHVGKQIFERFLTRGRMQELAENYISCSEDERIVDLYEKLDPQRLAFSTELGIRPLGAGSFQRFNQMHSNIISEKLNFPVLCDNCKYFERIFVEGKVYATERYCLPFKRDNSIVKLKYSSVCQIKNIIQFSDQCDCKETDRQCCFHNRGASKQFALIGEKILLSPASQVKDDHSGKNLTHFIGKVSNTNVTSEQVVFLPSEIECKCVMISHNGEKYCLKYDLMIELD